MSGDFVELLRDDFSAELKDSDPHTVINAYEEERHAAADRIEALEKEVAEWKARAVSLFHFAPDDLTCGDLQKARDEAANVEKLKEALRRVIAVADRDTEDFRFARAALEGKDD